MEERKKFLEELGKMNKFLSREAEELMSAKTPEDIKASLSRIEEFIKEAKVYPELENAVQQLEASFNNLKLNDVTRADLVENMQIFQKELDGLIHQIKVEIEKEKDHTCCTCKKEENPDEAAKAAKDAEIFKLLKELGVKSFHVEFE